MPSTLRVQLQLRIVSDDDAVIRDEVILELDKSTDRLAAVGLESTRNRGAVQAAAANEAGWTSLASMAGDPAGE